MTAIVVLGIALAVFVTGVITGMAIAREPLEDLLDAWPENRTGSYEDDHPVFRLVDRPPRPFDYERDGGL